MMGPRWVVVLHYARCIFFFFTPICVMHLWRRVLVPCLLERGVCWDCCALAWLYDGGRGCECESESEGDRRVCGLEVNGHVLYV
jgi:hypothetical protein